MSPDINARRNLFYEKSILRHMNMIKKDKTQNFLCIYEYYEYENFFGCVVNEIHALETKRESRNISSKKIEKYPKKCQLALINPAFRKSFTC